MKKRIWFIVLINIINLFLYIVFIEAIIYFPSPIPAICFTLPIYLAILQNKRPNLIPSLLLIMIYFALVILKIHGGLAAPAMVFLTGIFIISEALIFIFVNLMKKRRK